MKIVFNPLTGRFDFAGGAVSLLNLKGQVAAVGNLPSSGNTIGDVWQVVADLTFRVWDGVTWDNLGTFQGPAGQNIELQRTATHIQWRVVGGTWANLVALSDITGGGGSIYDALFGGTKIPFIANTPFAQTNGSTGASTDLSNVASAGTQPNMGTLSTGTTATGIAGFTLMPQGSAWGNNRGQHTLQSFSGFRGSFLVRVPTLSDATETFKVWIGGYGTSNNGVGALIDGSNVYAASASNGVETVSGTSATITANTLIKVDVEYTGTQILVRVNNGTAHSLGSGFTTAALGWGVYIVKSAGVTARTVNVANGSCFVFMTSLP